MISFDLTGKVAVITGASSGLGEQFAKALSEQGCDVAVLARRVERLEELSKKLKENGHDCLPVACDVTNEESIKEAVKKIEEHYGHIGILVNNAGVAQVSYFAAKGGVVNLTKAMAGDLAPYGILVNAIAPGVYDTEMTHGALDAPGSLVLKNRVALKRFGREGEMNGELVYFASDACTYTTGQTLVVDGGMTSML